MDSGRRILMAMELRPYQEEARRCIEDEWIRGRNRTLLVLPTGCGKTIVFAKIVEDMTRKGKRVLILAHRGELLDQALTELFKTTQRLTDEADAMASKLGFGGGNGGGGFR